MSFLDFLRAHIAVCRVAQKQYHSLSGYELPWQIIFSRFVRLLAHDKWWCDLGYMHCFKKLSRCVTTIVVHPYGHYCMPFDTSDGDYSVKHVSVVEQSRLSSIHSHLRQPPPQKKITSWASSLVILLCWLVSRALASPSVWKVFIQSVTYP
jgi:hypothetical protein